MMDGFVLGRIWLERVDRTYELTRGTQYGRID